MEPTLLVVDDNPTIRSLLRRVLARAGYRIREAEDGLQALAEIAVEPPALVLTDYLMPRMNDAELVAQVRHRPDPIPCILITSIDVDSRPHGVPILPKPFALASVVELVAQVLGPEGPLQPTGGSG